MSSESEVTQTEITTTLAYRNGALCVVAERASSAETAHETLKLWYPIRDAEEAEVSGLLGRWPAPQTPSRFEVESVD